MSMLNQKPNQQKRRGIKVTTIGITSRKEIDKISARFVDAVGPWAASAVWATLGIVMCGILTNLW